ncbi:sugar O-acetyltransferase [Methanobrevibacter sp.]|uniref:sugar O-acetyltransferase n=1 Tax=Methanobrevibacter sp. TaxID=66852 RepID=UPI00388D0D2D
MKEIEKLKAGLEYSYDDEEISLLKLRAIQNSTKFNSIDDADFEKQYEVLCEILGSVGSNVMMCKRFSFDNGKNIFIGDNFTANYNLTILDIKEVYIGDNVMIGPNTLITTVNHPLSPKGRRKHLAKATEIHIGNDVWLGGNVTVLPGVTIGNNVVVGAGAVVTKDIPDNSLALGVPARVVKKIDNDIEETENAPEQK